MEPNKLKEELINHVVKSTQHIVLIDPLTLKPTSGGSGCLIIYEDRLFFISVQHVTDKLGKQVALDKGIGNEEGTELFALPTLNFIDQLYFDGFEIGEPTLQKLKSLDICYTEITGSLEIKQRLLNFGDIIVSSDSKRMVYTNLDYEPTKEEGYCFHGRIRGKLVERTLVQIDKLVLGIKYDRKIGSFERFILDKPILDELDFQGTSGSPIFSETGEPVAFVAYGYLGENYLYGFSSRELKKYLDIYIDLNPSLTVITDENQPINFDDGNFSNFDGDVGSSESESVHQDSDNYFGLRSGKNFDGNPADGSPVQEVTKEGEPTHEIHNKEGFFGPETYADGSPVQEVTKDGEPTHEIHHKEGFFGPETNIKIIKITETSEYISYSVLYGTNRKIETNTDKIQISNIRDNSLHLGVCDVSIPSSHKTGNIERPNWFTKMFFDDSPENHFTVLNNDIIDESEFTNLLSQRIGKSDQNDVLLFIHGFNVGFNEAMMRTAQLGYDLNFKGGVTGFSWPTDGTITGYIADIDSAKLSSDYLCNFIKILIETNNVKKLHIIAHSMGNVVLTQALVKLKNEGTFPNTKFNQIILAAPDLDKDIFISQIMPAINRTSGLTLYASDKDKALITAKNIRKGYTRLGEGGNNIVIIDGLDSVDASKVDTNLLGHGYFADTQSLLNDIHMVLLGLPPDSRILDSRSKLVDGISKSYWVFRNS